MIHMHLWHSVMMQNIRTEQAEEKWSLHQYNFLQVDAKLFHSLVIRKIGYKVQRKAVADFRRW
jgi:hypothetical protein